MELSHPFSNDVRSLYLDCWTCWICGGNGTNRGGLALHHIWGRVSASALNSSCLCGTCHSHIGHSLEERLGLFRKTLNYLWKLHYTLIKVDQDFLELIKEDLRNFTI